VALCFAVVLKIFLVIFVRPIINIYRTDFYEICSIGKPLAVDEQSEVFFFDPSRDVALATNFVDKIDLLVVPRQSLGQRRRQRDSVLLIGLLVRLLHAVWRRQTNDLIR